MAGPNEHKLDTSRYARRQGLLSKLEFNPRLPICLRMLFNRCRAGERDMLHSSLYLAIGVLIISLATAIFISLPQAPYNVQELFGDNFLPLSIPLFALCLLWIAGAPNLLARVTIICPLLQFLQPLVLVMMAFPAWVLLRFAVSAESLLDVLGDQPDEWNMFVAFIGLITPVLLSLFIWNLLFEGSAWLNRRFGIGQMLAALTIGLPVLWASKYIVIDQATTTRIIDLSAQGPFWLIGGLLAAGLSVLTLNGVLLAWSIIWNNLSRIIIVLLTPCFMYLSWLLTSRGLNAESVEFLLGVSPKLEHSSFDLFLRWSLVYLSAVILIAAAHQIPFRLRGSHRHQRRAFYSGQLHSGRAPLPAAPVGALKEK